MVLCGCCKLNLDESPSLQESERKPCSRCGSTSRNVEVAVADKIDMHALIKGKLKNKEEGVKVEVVQGDSLTIKTGLWATIERIIDFVKNWYHEKIVEKYTGKVLREVDEPLSEHRNRGSAKPKDNKKD